MGLIPGKSSLRRGGETVNDLSKVQCSRHTWWRLPNRSAGTCLQYTGTAIRHGTCL